MKALKILWWQIRYTVNFMKKVQWNRLSWTEWSNAWANSGAAIENCEYDTREDPIEWVDEELSCWSD